MHSRIRTAVAIATGLLAAHPLSAQGPMPEAFSGKVEPGVLGVIGPHDDYVYAARTYRRAAKPGH